MEVGDGFWWFIGTPLTSVFTFRVGSVSLDYLNKSGVFGSV